MELNDVSFYIIDVVIVLLLIRVDWHLARIARNTRKDDHHAKK